MTYNGKVLVTTILGKELIRGVMTYQEVRKIIPGISGRRPMAEIWSEQYGWVITMIKPLSEANEEELAALKS